MSGEYSNSGLSVDDVLAQLPTSFVSNGATMTVAQLLANYPPDASMLYKYGRVSDLYGIANSIMICEASGGSYYWRPQRTDYTGVSAATTGTVALIPLITPPILFLTGNLTGNMSITPSTTNVWPGATFTVVANGLLNLLNINITGLVGGSTLPILSGSSRTMSYVQGSGWRAG